MYYNFVKHFDTIISVRLYRLYTAKNKNVLKVMCYSFVKQRVPNISTKLKDLYYSKPTNTVLLYLYKMFIY